MLAIIIGILAMSMIVTASNILVRYPINDWLTWATFVFPVAFLVTDLVNRYFGPRQARNVVYVGFVVGVVCSYWLSTPRIAMASGIAFFLGQMLDIYVFHRLRQMNWWKAPVISSGSASALDTAVFYSLAFAGTGLPWTTWAIGDLFVKLAVAVVMLIPYYYVSKYASSKMDPA